MWQLELHKQRKRHRNKLTVLVFEMFIQLMKL